MSAFSQQGLLGRPRDTPPIDEARRAKIEMYKVQFITEKLNLTKAEAELFWPVYNEAKKNIDEFESMIKPPSKVVSSIVNGKTTVKEWIDKQNYLESYLSPWTETDDIEPIWNAFNDSEFFRIYNEYYDSFWFNHGAWNAGR